MTHTALIAPNYLKNKLGVQISAKQKKSIKEFGIRHNPNGLQVSISIEDFLQKLPLKIKFKKLINLRFDKNQIHTNITNNLSFTIGLKKYLLFFHHHPTFPSFALYPT